MRIGILSAELGAEDVYENKRLVREIRLKGHRAQIINYRKTVLVTTKNKGVLFHPDGRGVLQPVRLHAVIPRINEADEQSINLAALALESLMANGVYSTASPSAIRLSKNKIASLMVLAGNVPVPRSAAVTGTESYQVDIDIVLKTVEPNPSKRLIIKTNTGTHGRGVMPANTRGEAGAILDGFLAHNVPVMIQQFVEPTRRGRYIDLRFVVVGGKVVSAMKRMATKKDEIRANITLGGQGLFYEPSETETQTAINAAKAMGLGVAGVDIIPSGKSRVVIEVNSSPGFIIEQVNQVNVAKKIVALAVAGARKGQKTTSEKLVEKLHTPINLAPLPASFKPLKKIKLVPKKAG
jgi:ribosomal protein S6--L-glutamate ligase